MRTSKPVATISYNTPAYLKLKLEELRKAGRVSEWYFVEHQPEEDEKKEHIHVYVVPSKMLQTDDLRTEFMEIDPTHPDKPRGCIRWVSSKFADWYLYGLHDEAYLASKGQARKYHYRREDFLAFDEDALDECIREIDLTTVNAVKRMQDAQRAGMTWVQFFKVGGVPVQAIRAYQEAWNTLLMAGQTYRAGRDDHEPAVDPDTGECDVP